MSPKPEMLIEMRFLVSSEYKEQIAPHVRTVLRIQPYILDPRLPATTYETPTGIYEQIHTTPYQANQPPTKKEYYGQKFGAGLDAFDRRISAAAQEVGLVPFVWDSDGKVGATWDCHRLMVKTPQLDEQDPKLAEGEPERCLEALQVRLMERFYKDFFVASRDMSDRSYLAGVAVEFGLFGDTGAALAWLQSDEADYELRHKLKLVEMNGVQQVPFYIINEGADHMAGWSEEHALRIMQMQVAALVR